jgi:tight adherence protein B
VPTAMIPLMTFTAILLAAFSIYSVVSDVFLRDRTRISQRVDERFRLRQRERAEKSILFKDLGQFAAEVAEAGAKPSFRQRLEDMIEQSGLDVTSKKLLTISAGSGIITGLIFGVFYGPIVGALVAAGAFPIPILRVWLKKKARLDKLRTQLPDAFDLMARVIRAGQTMNQAMLAVVDEFPMPISAEFNLCYEQQNLGLSPDDAYQDLSRRTDLVEVKIFVMASMVQRQTGGNLAELLEKLSVMLRDRFRIQGVVKSLTAEGRMQAVLLMALPPVMFFMMFALNPAYMRQLLVYPKVLAGTLFIEMLGGIWIRKIVNFDF